MSKLQFSLFVYESVLRHNNPPPPCLYSFHFGLDIHVSRQSPLQMLSLASGVYSRVFFFGAGRSESLPVRFIRSVMTTVVTDLEKKP